MEKRKGVEGGGEKEGPFMGEDWKNDWVPGERLVL